MNEQVVLSHDPQTGKHGGVFEKHPALVPVVGQGLHPHAVFA